MIMSHTLIQLLDAEFDEIHVAAPHATASLAERMAEVKSVIPLDIKHGQLAIGERWRAGRDITRIQANAAYVLPNSWKSALLPFFAGIPRRVGWHGEARYLLLNARRTGVEKYPLIIRAYRNAIKDMVEIGITCRICFGLGKQFPRETARCCLERWAHPR